MNRVLPSIIPDFAGATLRAFHDRGAAVTTLAIALVAFAATPAAFAADNPETRLTRMEADIQATSDRTDSLSLGVVPGRAYLNLAEAEQQFEEHLYEYLIGEYDQSASGFFALVTSEALTDAGLHRDAEWYLADSLFELQNYGLSESRFAVIAEDEGHPFHDDAVRRLLELYAQSGQNDKFQEAYDHWIVQGRVKPSDRITYAIGKAFWRRALSPDEAEGNRAGDLVQAKSHLNEIPATSDIYNKARYFLGAIAVQENQLDDAAGYFKQVLDVSVDSDDDRKILDLALLALGRIGYERGNFAEAADWYGRIGGDSAYLDDKLYEIVWTFIKQEEWDQALNGVDIFLLAYPDHRYTARMKLIQGHLHVKQQEYDPALSSYETVISDYTPLRERFSQLAQDPAQSESYFKAMAETHGDKAPDDTLPDYAVAMMKSDPDLVKALGTYVELKKQSDTIDASQKDADELNAALAGATTLKGYERMKGEVGVLRQTAMQQRMDLLRIEEDWLYSQTSKDQRPQVDKLKKEREQLLNDIAAVPATAEVPSFTDAKLLSRLDALRGEYAQTRKAVADTQGYGDRFDKGDSVLIQLDGRLARTNDKIEPIEQDELVRVKDRLAFETTEVASERVDLGTTTANADAAAAILTQAGFGRLADFFDQSILHADMGIVDLYWDEKIQSSDELTKTAQEEKDRMDALDQQFDIVRKKLPNEAGSPTAAAGSTTGGTP